MASSSGRPALPWALTHTSKHVPLPRGWAQLGMDHCSGSVHLTLTHPSDATDPLGAVLVVAESRLLEY